MVSVYFGRLAWKDWICNSSSDFLNLKSWTQSMNKTFHLYLTPDLSSISYIMLIRLLCWVFCLPLQIHNPVFSALLWAWLLWTASLCSPTSMWIWQCEGQPWEWKWEGLKLVYLLPLCLSHRIIRCDCFPLLKVIASVSQPSPCRYFHVPLTTDGWVDRGEIWEEKVSISCTSVRLFMVW